MNGAEFRLGLPENHKIHFFSFVYNKSINLINRVYSYKKGAFVNIYDRIKAPWQTKVQAKMAETEIVFFFAHSFGICLDISIINGIQGILFENIVYIAMYYFYIYMFEVKLTLTFP